MQAWFEESPAILGERAWGMTWGINAPGYHPLWHQYLLFLYDLTTPLKQASKIYLPGATHEMILYAVDPDKPLPQPPEKLMPENNTSVRFGILTPANYGYQFRASNNATAQQRIQKLVDHIVQGTLSPDTDFRTHWDSVLFPDAYPLVRNGLAEMFGAPSDVPIN